MVLQPVFPLFPWTALSQISSRCFGHFFDQQDPLSEQTQTFVLFSVPTIEFESWKKPLLTNTHGNGINQGIHGINQLSWTLLLYLFPQQQKRSLVVALVIVWMWSCHYFFFFFFFIFFFNFLTFLYYKIPTSRWPLSNWFCCKGYLRSKWARWHLFNFRCLENILKLMKSKCLTNLQNNFIR